MPKYTRREGSPGNYVYFYDEPGTGSEKTSKVHIEEAKPAAQKEALGVINNLNKQEAELRRDFQEKGGLGGSSDAYHAKGAEIDGAKEALKECNKEIRDAGGDPEKAASYIQDLRDRSAQYRGEPISEGASYEKKARYAELSGNIKIYDIYLKKLKGD